MVTFHGAAVLAEFVCDSATSALNVHTSAFCTGDQLCRSHLSKCSSCILIVVQLCLRACYF